MYTMNEKNSFPNKRRRKKCKLFTKGSLYPRNRVEKTKLWQLNVRTFIYSICNQYYRCEIKEEAVSSGINKVNIYAVVS